MKVFVGILTFERTELCKAIRRNNQQELGIDSAPFQEKMAYVRPSDLINTITSVQKDNLLVFREVA